MNASRFVHWRQSKYMPNGRLIVNKKQEAYDRMETILRGAKMENRGLNEAEKAEFDKHEAEFRMAQLSEPGDVAETRGTADTTPGTMAVRGNAREFLRPNQSVREWCESRGLVRGNKRTDATDFDWDAYWGQRLGFMKPGLESRTVYGLGEDTSSGSGAGQSIVGQLWGHELQDLIRAKLWLSHFNVTTVPMVGEILNVPVFEADVAPAFITENTALSLDTTPNVGSLTLSATGAYADVTAASLAIIEDAVINGGVDGLIRNSIAQKYARLIETIALYGQSGSGTTGLVSTTGLLVQSMGTNGAAPTNYSNISKAVAQVREQSVEPSGLVWHPGTKAEYAELTDTLGQPMRPTPDVADLVNNAQDSALLNYQSETQGSSSTASSLYVGDWQYCLIGMRTEGVEVSILKERYAEYQMVGFLSRWRGCVQYLHPTQAFCRLEGIL
jgi:HK97 family phage major capsid protein